MCSDDIQKPIGSCMRTPSYLSVVFILENLLRFGHIELCEEQEGRRMLVKGLSPIYSLSEHINVLLKDVEQVKPFVEIPKVEKQPSLWDSLKL